jgi:hypothetical protein
MRIGRRFRKGRSARRAALIHAAAAGKPLPRKGKINARCVPQRITRMR